MHDEHVLDDQFQLGLVVHLLKELPQLSLNQGCLFLRKQTRNLENTCLDKLHQILTVLVIVVNSQQLDEYLGKDSSVFVDFAFPYHELGIP